MGPRNPAKTGAAGEKRVRQIGEALHEPERQIHVEHRSEVDQQIAAQEDGEGLKENEPSGADRENARGQS